MSHEKLQEILHLSHNEKLAIYEALANDLYGENENQFELTEEQRKELQRRIHEVESGQAKLIPWEEIRKKYGK